MQQFQNKKSLRRKLLDLIYLCVCVCVFWLSIYEVIFLLDFVYNLSFLMTYKNF